MKSETIEQRRWVGRVLRDRWKIDERLSRGGVGTVYAATHKNNGSRAAIKVLHPEFARDADTRSRFLQEGYAANQVNHPGVVRVLDDDTTDDGHAFIVMELLEGELLEKRRVRKGGKLPLTEVYEVGEQLLDVLAAAHDKDIVHRDIKPENLFITREGRLKVLDFGFAQMKSGFRKEQTATGFLLGTPGFMSPEQAVGNRAEIDAKTDIWAVGATLFTLLSGEPVHDGQSAAEMLVAAANFPPRSLATVTEGLPQKLIDLVDRAVAFDKHDRWSSARSMQSALREIALRQSNPEPHRRPMYSIPEREPIHDEPTLYTGGEVQELASEDLIESASESMQQAPAADNERTLMAPANRKLPTGALPSEITKPQTTTARPPRPAAGRPATARHAADDDGPTLAQPSPRDAAPVSGLDSDNLPTTTDAEAFRTAPDGAPAVTFGTPESDPTRDGGTLIMESNVGLRDADPAFSPTLPQPVSPPYPVATADGRGAQGGYAPPNAMPMHAYPTVDVSEPPRAMRSGPHPGPPPANRVLVFVGVAVVTMVVVIAAGLVFLGLGD